MNKLTHLHQQIHSPKYSKSVQDSLDYFTMNILNIIGNDDILTNSEEIQALSENKQREIYTYKYLLIEKQIEDLKNGFEDTQRIQTEGKNEDKFKKFNHLNENKLKQALLNKRNIRFYNFQFLFSKPDDYKELENDNITNNDENNLIDSLVFSVDKIQDSLLLNLGLLGDDYTKLVEEKKKTRKKLNRNVLELQLLIRKIDAVKQLKTEVKGFYPLDISARKSTTRIMIVKSNNENNGKIILTQSPESFKRKGVNTLDMKKTISVFDDIFSLYRSQIYSLKNIEEKKGLVKQMKDESHKLSLEWNTRFELDSGELKGQVDWIGDNLDGYDTYFEKKVVKNRLPKVGFNNTSSDSKVMYGVKNDLCKSFLKLTANESVIVSQVGVISEIIDEQTVKYKTFFKEFSLLLNSMDQKELTGLINTQYESEFKRNFDNNKEIFQKITRVFNTFLVGGFENIPKPFNDFYFEVEKVNKKIKDAINNGDIIIILRQLFLLNLKLKLKRFEVFEYILKTTIKLENSGDNILLIENTLLYLDKYKKLLENKNFLGAVTIGESINDEYEKQLSKIDNMIEYFNGKL